MVFQGKERYFNSEGLDFSKELSANRLVEIFNLTLNCPVDFAKKHRANNLEDEIKLFEEFQSGACSAKHYYLGKQLENLGFTTFYLTIPFYWQEQPFKYPSSLRQLGLQMPLQYHAALLIESGDRLIQLDATWDEPLSVAGFPNNKLFSLADTQIGVIPKGKITIHPCAQEKWQYILKLKQQMPHDPFVPQFYSQFNNWLQEIRSQNGFLANKQ